MPPDIPPGLWLPLELLLGEDEDDSPALGLELPVLPDAGGVGKDEPPAGLPDEGLLLEPCDMLLELQPARLSNAMAQNNDELAGLCMRVPAGEVQRQQQYITGNSDTGLLFGAAP